MDNSTQRSRLFLQKKSSAVPIRTSLFSITQKLKMSQKQRASAVAAEHNNNELCKQEVEDEEVYYEDEVDVKYEVSQNGMNGMNGYDEDDGQGQDYQEEDEEQEEEEYDYPDISEFVTTEIEGDDNDEEDRGLPPAGLRLTPQPGYYYDDEEEEEEVEDETAALLNQLPPGTFIQARSAPPSAQSSGNSSSTSARTNTLLNNFLLRNNRVSSTRNNAMLLEEDENDEQYFDDSGVPLSLIVEPQVPPPKRPAMNKVRNLQNKVSASSLSTSALLEQLQSPAFSRPNILSRKLMQGHHSQQATTLQLHSPPPPRLQPRPNSRVVNHQQQPSISLESILRKQVSLQQQQQKHKQMPRLQTLTSSKPRAATSSNNFIIDGRKLSFKSGSLLKPRLNTTSPTRSLESLMLSHQRSQLQQQLSSRNNEFLQLSNLQVMQVNKKQQVPRCHVCKKTFATNQVLQRHMQSVHGVVEQDNAGVMEQNGGNSNGVAHRCRVCYRTFGSLESLRAHALNHEGEFKCRACRRGFPSWEILEQHESTHKKYECRWCEKYFMNSGNLKAHERIHTGERPYKCADCPKGFKQLGGLQYHLKTNPTHRPQKYKLEDQQSSSNNNNDPNSPQDYSMSHHEDNGEGDMLDYDDDGDRMYIDVPA